MSASGMYGFNRFVWCSSCVSDKTTTCKRLRWLFWPTSLVRSLGISSVALLCEGDGAGLVLVPGKMTGTSTGSGFFDFDVTGFGFAITTRFYEIFSRRKRSLKHESTE